MHKTEPARRSAVVVMAKNPTPGTVKTRLVPTLTAVEAATLYAAFLRDVVDESVARDWESIVAHHPPEATDFLRDLVPPADRLLSQRGDDLAARMINVFDDLLSTHDAVVMRGSDSPTLPRRILHDAFERLATEDVDVVLGPDHGGGYYLVGLKQPAPDLFRLEMSTHSNYERTVARAQELGLRIAELERWSDVDTPDDLAALTRRIGDKDAMAPCPRTVEIVSRRYRTT